MKEAPYRCCRRCLHWLPETTEFFPRYTSASSGERVLRRTCRQCVKERQARIALADAEIAEAAQSDWQSCSSCRTCLPYTREFFAPYTTKYGKSGLRKTCLECLGRFGRRAQAKTGGPIVETAIASQPNSVFARGEAR